MVQKTGGFSFFVSILMCELSRIVLESPEFLDSPEVLEHPAQYGYAVLAGKESNTPQGGNTIPPTGGNTIPLAWGILSPCGWEYYAPDGGNTMSSGMEYYIFGGRNTQYPV